MSIVASDKHQRGITTVEFSIVGAILFFMLLAAIEVGRYMYVINAAAEVTRLAARLTAVCPRDNDAAIKAIAVFNGSPILPSDLKDALRLVRYDENFNQTVDISEMQFAEAYLENYTFNWFIPGVPGPSLPPLTVTRITESLGIVPGVGPIPCST